MSTRKVVAGQVIVTDSDSCSASDDETMLCGLDGNVITKAPRTPGPPPPPWEAHADLPEWQERREAGWQSPGR